MYQKEKAKELVEKFKYFSYFSDGVNSMEREFEREDNARECALVCIDEIIKTLEDCQEFKDVNPNLPIEYWRGVRNEV